MQHSILRYSLLSGHLGQKAGGVFCDFILYSPVNLSLSAQLEMSTQFAFRFHSRTNDVRYGEQ